MYGYLYLIKLASYCNDLACYTSYLREYHWISYSCRKTDEMSAF